MDRFFRSGAAVAARVLKYPRVASLIVDDDLSAERVVRLFRLSASKKAKRDAAIIIFAGSVAWYRGKRGAWSAEPVASLVRGLIGDEFNHASNAATRLVREHWSEIEQLANGAEAA